MRTLAFLTFLVLLQNSNLAGRNILHNTSQETDTVKLHIATVYLNDGTRVWGILIGKTEDSLYINDFNVGQLSIARSGIKDLEVNSVSGNVIIETVNGTSYYGEIISLESGILTIHSATLGA